MTPLEVFEKYRALKLHFTTKSFDYHKYAGKIKSNSKKFEQTLNKVWAQKLSKHKDVETFLLANIVADPKIYIRDLTDSQRCEKIYLDFVKRNQILGYLFKQELDKIDDIKQACSVAKINHPEIFKKYLSRDISLETLSLMLDITGILPIWDSKMKDDIVWKLEGQKITKFIPFLPKEKNKFKRILVDKIKQI